MRLGLLGFRVFLVAGWLALVWVTLRAVTQAGVGAAWGVFIADFADPWRVQFDTDFALHVLLIAAWMVYRAPTWGIGLLTALLAVALGGLFTLAYILVLAVLARGDMRVVLLGPQARSAEL